MKNRDVKRKRRRDKKPKREAAPSTIEAAPSTIDPSAITPDLVELGYETTTIGTHKVMVLHRDGQRISRKRKTLEPFPAYTPRSH